jgi:ABC-type polysaccharide/polyol phosphate transport system, ATPase component
MAQFGQVAIRLSNVWKVFRSYRAVPRTLKEALLSFGRWKPVEVVALKGIDLEVRFGES